EARSDRTGWSTGSVRPYESGRPVPTLRLVRLCTVCGSESPPEARFCAQCGTALAGTCERCGVELPPTGRFCPSCGAPVAEVATPGEERKLVTVLFAGVA